MLMEKLTIASLFMMLFLETWMNGTQLDEWLIDLHVTIIAKNAKNIVSEVQVKSSFDYLKYCKRYFDFRFILS